MRKLPKISENWLDKAISYVNPQAGLKRLEAKTRLAIAGGLGGGYTGARKDRRQTSSWNTVDGSADNVTLPDLPALRQRSRDLLRNAPLATGAVNTVVTNVVGTGLKVQSHLDRDVLKPYFKSEDEFDAFERNAERIFRNWAESADSDITRCQTFSEIQNLILRSVLESGDVFILKRNVARPNRNIDLALQIIEADRVVNPNFEADKATLAGGIKMDSDGAPISYSVCNRHPDDYQNGERKFVDIPAFDKYGNRQVFHIFNRTRPGLTRGIPYLAPVIESLKQLDRYTEAEIMAAVVSAMFTVFVKSEDEEGLAPMTPNESGTRHNDGDYKLAPGAILDLEPGENIEIADPKRPNQAFDPFVQAVLRQVGVALELPFEILIKHFTASYSAAQAALVEAWKFFSSRRKWLSIQLCQPVYEMVITEAVAKGLLKAPNFFANPEIRNAYLGAEWIGPPRGQIDQFKEVRAAETRVNIGISTLAEETAMLTGGDWERKYPQILKEYKLKKEAGLLPKELLQQINQSENQGQNQPAKKPTKKSKNNDA